MANLFLIGVVNSYLTVNNQTDLTDRTEDLQLYQVEGSFEAVFLLVLRLVVLEAVLNTEARVMYRIADSCSRR